MVTSPAFRYCVHMLPELTYTNIDGYTYHLEQDLIWFFEANDVLCARDCAERRCGSVWGGGCGLGRGFPGGLAAHSVGVDFLPTYPTQRPPNCSLLCGEGMGFLGGLCPPLVPSLILHLRLADAWVGRSFRARSLRSPLGVLLFFPPFSLFPFLFVYICIYVRISFYSYSLLPSSLLFLLCFALFCYFVSFTLIYIFFAVRLRQDGIAQR